MEEHLAKVKRMEQEKADLAAESFRRLEEQERLFAQEMEKLKEKQRYSGKEKKAKVSHWRKIRARALEKTHPINKSLVP